MHSLAVNLSHEAIHTTRYTHIRVYKLTLSRMMSISEYFIPLTSTGMSLEQKPEEKVEKKSKDKSESQSSLTSDSTLGTV